MRQNTFGCLDPAHRVASAWRIVGVLRRWSSTRRSRYEGRAALGVESGARYTGCGGGSRIAAVTASTVAVPAIPADAAMSAAPADTGTMRRLCANPGDATATALADIDNASTTLLLMDFHSDCGFERSAPLRIGLTKPAPPMAESLPTYTPPLTTAQ